MEHDKKSATFAPRASVEKTAAVAMAGASAQEGAGAIQAAGSQTVLGHIRHGSGPEPVLVLHEWMGDHRNYDLMLPFLPLDTFTWVFADLRGYGFSRSMTGSFSLDEATDDVLRLMHHYGYQRFHVVGHSMSGMIAQYLAKRAGGRVQSVVAISPVPASGFRVDEEALKQLKSVVDDGAAMEHAILARGGNRYGRGWVERKLAMTRQATTRPAMLGYLDMFTQSDVSAQVRGFPVPLTAVCGEFDLPQYRADSVRSLLGPLFPNLEVEVSHEAGHYPMLETPPLMAGQIEKGLARGIQK
jgi:pimeloyl-ACP methyl ester carboxylesterase